MREQYKAQKEEEETKRQFYHSPETARREGTESTDQLEESSEHEQTPEPSPALNQREEQVIEAVQPAPQPTVHAPQPVPRQATPPQPAPKPTKTPPQVAPRPSTQSRGIGQANGGRVGDSPPTSPAFNPYPPPSQVPRSPKGERLPSPQQPAPPPPAAQRVTPPVAPLPRTSPDKEALFNFAWYHGSIPRDEALRRLEGVGGYDG